MRFWKFLKVDTSDVGSRYYNELLTLETKGLTRLNSQSIVGLYFL